MHTYSPGFGVEVSIEVLAFFTKEFIMIVSGCCLKVVAEAGLCSRFLGVEGGFLRDFFVFNAASFCFFDGRITVCCPNILVSDFTDHCKHAVPNLSNVGAIFLSLH